MTGPSPALDIEALLAEEDFVRRLARALVFDDHRADDVVQQTWLDAMRRPPALQDRSALRGWLATVIRRRAADDLRDRRRRREVERDGARHEVTLPSADELLAREEARRGVIDELRKLDEPFRTAVALRYLEGLDPVEIAARQGVPAATVRGRVRRGLRMLRDRLDRRHGGDRHAWCLALLPLVAPANSSAATGVAAASILTSFVIAMKLLLPLVLAASAAIALVAFWPNTPGPAKPPATSGASAASANVAQLDAEPAPAGPAESPLRSPVEPPVDAPPADEADAPTQVVRIHGRCVDEEGAPLAGGTITVHGGSAGEQRMAAWLLEHDAEPDWTDPAPVATAPDGRFEVTFPAFPPLQYALHAEATDRVAIGFRWIEIEPGTLDLGDVALLPGTRVRGRVVDAEGLPVPERLVEIVPPALFGFGGGRNPLDAGRPRTHAAGRTDAAGRFEFDRVLPAGDYQFRVRDRQVKDPAGTVGLEGPAFEQTIVAVDPNAGRRTISGIVIDESGSPLAGATIGVGELPDFPTGMRHGEPTARSGRDGRFTIGEVDGPGPDRVSLSAFADGFLRWRSTDDVGWDGDEVRITLHRGPSLTVRAVDEAGAPIERFGVSLAPRRANGAWSSNDSTVRAPGEHPNGVVRLDGVTPGTYQLQVRPADTGTYALSEPVEIEMRAGLPVSVEIRVPSPVAQPIEVVDASGSPLAGVVAELARHPNGDDLTLQTTLMDERYAWGQSRHGRVGILDASVTTDAAGRATVRGTTDRRYALRFPGPGHVPTVIQPVQIDPERPIRITLFQGGTLRGRFGPSAILDGLRTHGPLAVALLGVGANAGTEIPTTNPATRMSHTVDAEGRFTIAGAPPGPWQVALRWNEPFVFGTTMKQRVAIEQVEIVDGETVEVEAELSGWQRHDVAVLTLLDGEPASIQMAGRLLDAAGEPGPYTAQIRTDGQGRATLQLEEGRWLLDLMPMVEGVPIRRLGIPVDVIGPVPATAPVQLEIRSARRAIRLLRPDGSPARGVELTAQQSGPTAGNPLMVPSAGSPPTDSDGRTMLIGTPGTWTVRAPREPFLEMEAFFRWQAEEQRRDGSLRFVELGSVTLDGPQEPLEIRLPESWTQLPD